MTARQALSVGLYVVVLAVFAAIIWVLTGLIGKNDPPQPVVGSFSSQCDPTTGNRIYTFEGGGYPDTYAVAANDQTCPLVINE